MFRTTIDSLVSDIKNRVGKLQQLEVAHADRAEELHAQASALRAEAHAEEAESYRAARLASKFSALIS